MKTVQYLIFAIMGLCVGVLLVLKYQQNKANDNRTAAARAARWKTKEEKQNDESAEEISQIDNQNNS